MEIPSFEDMVAALASPVIPTASMEMSDSIGFNDMVPDVYRVVVTAANLSATTFSVTTNSSP